MSKQLLKSTVTVGGMTLISRVFGFIRDMVAAHFFGASASYDAFIVASKIPNFLRRLFAEGAFSQAFVPILSEYRSQKSSEAVTLLVNRVFGCLSLILLVVTLLGMLASPLLIRIFAPGFGELGDSRLGLAATMLKITFPYLFWVSLTAFSAGILNCYGRFAVPAFTPVFLNIALIVAAVWLSPHLKEPVVALAWGIVGGGVIQFLFQLPFLKKLHLLPRPQWGWQDPGVKRILKLMAPALVGVSVNQLNLMLSAIFASFLPAGSVSWLYYAERLMEFPLGGFGVALSTVILPHLSRHHVKSQGKDFAITLDWGVRWIMLIGLPAALGLGLLAGPLLATLFQSGHFTEKDVMFSQSCLIAYAVGIIGFMLVKIFASAYYAKQDVKTPVRIALIIVISNVLLNAVLIQPLAHMGLALATSLAALLNAGLLGIGLIKRDIYRIQKGWGVLGIRLLLALVAMSFVIVYLNPGLEAWFEWRSSERALRLGLLMVAGGLAYFGVLFITGLRMHHLLMKVVES